MARHNSIRSVAIAIAGSSSLAMASVASAAPTRVSPLVALSVFGTPQSAAAVSRAGAVGPQLAPSAAPYAMSTAAMVQDDRYDRDPNYLPLLVAIGAMALIVLIFHDEFFDEGGEIRLPIPISPG
jgi:hypothetical protein